MPAALTMVVLACGAVAEMVGLATTAYGIDAATVRVDVLLTTQQGAELRITNLRKSPFPACILVENYRPTDRPALPQTIFIAADG